ncbi:MAG: hypothetical protein P4L27_03005 [Ignavibacteriaceae bacterium]|nr:hypothetical protein [Ignavibacteriaceae bacterium]
MNPDISHKIKVISESHIYFGHQSVGENIVSGLNKIISGSGQNEFIVKELNNNNKILNSYYFVHSKIGNNGDPKGKFREFAKIVEILSRKNLELAMMKLCFVDINKNSNLENIFNSYVNTIDSLQKRYPNLTIVHFTVPIKSQPTWIKKIKAILMNRDLDDPQDNIARDKYNKLILAKYPKECIFDLAKAESTYPDDKREIIMVNGIPAYSMIKDFTDDGGHLNMKGQKVISRELIEKIFEIITMKKSIN